jgi:serine/threonine protein kinase
VPELRPRGWRTTPLGRGGFGTVYRAKWRGREVAVKEIMLPTEPTNASYLARQELKKRCALIAQDFVTEVEVCCDLHHPNLVKLMGYATKPRLIIVQELLLGNSLDHQLYTECWKPNRLQTLKVALDIAQGMHYLHTAFERKLGSGSGGVEAAGEKDESCDQAIIHCDLKSPNLLLLTPPNLSSASDEWLLIKITDFGLSKDKSLDEAKQTALMTGCGSMLWMAPEIIAGQVLGWCAWH